MNVALEPTAKVAWLAEVIAGADFTVRVKDWVASEPIPFEARMVNV